jgi:predicted HTH domain antitoxin
MEAAKMRNQVLLKILKRIKNEMGEKGQHLGQEFMSLASDLSPDSLERTMLLTILITGNYDYFSAYNSRTANTFYEKQNKEVTQKRLIELLKIYNYGYISFKETAEILSASVPTEQQVLLKRIFEEEAAHLVPASELEIRRASVELLDFFSNDIFSDTAPADGSTTPGRHVKPVSTGEAA